MERLKAIAVSSILLFILWAAYTLAFQDAILSLDRLGAAFVLFILLLGRKQFRMTMPILLAFVGALALHNFHPYGNHYFGVPFDIYMHVIMSAVIAFFVHNYMTGIKGKSKDRLNGYEIFLISVLMTIGAGAIVEIMESMAYLMPESTLGIFGYGPGDVGEIRDISTDMIANLGGAIVGWLAGVISRRRI